MDVNEKMEFEAINKKVQERTVNVEEVQHNAAEAYREARIRKNLKAVIFIIISAGLFALAATGFWALEEIEWINHSFRNVLTAAAGAVAMFKIGCFWSSARK